MPSITLFKLLRNNSFYLVICLSGLISNIGAGLTQVAVYGELAKNNAPTYYYTLAYSFALLPGIFSSSIGVYLAYRYRWNYILIFAEILGALFLIFPILGIKYHSFPLLIISEFSSCFIIGLIGPILAVFTRHTFADAELPLVSYIETYIFSTQAIVGIGVGSFLYKFSDSSIYLYLDFFSYLISAGALWIFSIYFQINQLQVLPEKKEKNRFQWNSFTNTQKLSFLLLLILTVIGVPAISLLPMVALRCSQTNLPENTVVLFLFAKVLGQLLGPFFTRSKNFDEYQKKPIKLVFNCVIFLMCYIFSYVLASEYIGFFLITIAHIFSNIFFVIAIYVIKRNFSEGEIGIVYTRQYQAQILLIFILSIATGLLSKYINFVPLILSTSLIGIGALILTSKFLCSDFRNKNLLVATQNKQE